MSNILHVRSKDLDQIDDVYNSNFVINLKAPIQASPGQAIHVSLISCEIPHSFYCISSDLKNNTIVYDTDSVLTLPNQNYDIDELLRVINADSSFPFTATYGTFTNKLKFTNPTSESHDLNWNVSLASKLLGFQPSGYVTVDAGGSVTSDGVVDLATVHSIFIRSDLSSGNVQSTNGGNSTVLQKVSVDCNPWNVVYFNESDHITTSVITKSVIDHITVRLTDKNDNLLNFNRVNFEFALRFDVKDAPVLKHIDSVAELESKKPKSLALDEGDDIDDTHPVEGKSEIEHVGEQIVLDALLEKLND